MNALFPRSANYDELVPGNLMGPHVLWLMESLCSRTELAPGVDAGGGLRFRLSPVRLFIEARYNNVYTRHGNTSFLPIVFGTEW